MIHKKFLAELQFNQEDDFVDTQKLIDTVTTLADEFCN